jgi:hypothetical protein
MKGKLQFLLVSVIIFSSPILANDQTVQVRDDFGVGIKSNIFVLIGEKNKPRGVTNDTGILAVTNLCQPGEQIEADPINALYYKGISDCQTTNGNILVKVTSKAFANNLWENATKLEQTGRYGTAALGFTEFAARVARINPEEAGKARVKAYFAFAKSINVTDEDKVVQFDQHQQAYVLTGDFVEVLKAFQEEKGLKQTGHLDFSTVSSQAAKTITNLGTQELQIQ